MDLLDPAYNITPIDGRYAKELAELRPLLSEYALMKNRVLIEARHLIYLSDYPGVNLKKLRSEEKQMLLDLYRSFSVQDYQRIKEIEEETRHDVKSVEIFFREKLKGTALEDLCGLVHVFFTSEDVTNLAYALMVRDAIFKVYLPNLVELESKLVSLAEKYKGVAMLGRTHGQAAVPTTLGKEIIVTADRLQRRMERLVKVKFTGKISGAVGSYNSFCVAYPDVDWIDYSVKFIKDLGLEPRIITTQILPHDEMSDILREIISINQIIREFDENMWRYISDGWIVQKPKEKEVGSSTMPQKVNPIDFENSEGCTKVSSALCAVLADELQRSRLQRDLSGSTLQRWYGAALATSLQAIKRTTKALDTIDINKEELNKALINHPEAIMEAVQTIGRLEGIQDIYDRTKRFSRGAKLTLDEIRSFITQLPLSKEKKEKLLSLDSFGYVGLSERLTEIGIRNCRRTISRVRKKLEKYYLTDLTKLPED